MNKGMGGISFALVVAAPLATVSVWLCGMLLAAESREQVRGNDGPARGTPRITSLEELSDLVGRHLASRAGHKPGCLISKSEVAPIISELRADGWSEAGLDRVCQAVLDDKHFLVRQLRSPQGQKFAAAVAKHKGAYDRLDRVSQAKGGQRAIANTILLPDGAGFWNPDSKPGFANTVQMLPTRGGRRRSKAEFSEPTGKIYTGEQLIEQLAPLCPTKEKKLQPREKAGP
jgi:hypothetical protein